MNIEDYLTPDDTMVILPLYICDKKCPKIILLSSQDGNRTQICPGCGMKLVVDGKVHPKAIKYEYYV